MLHRDALLDANGAGNGAGGRGVRTGRGGAAAALSAVFDHDHRVVGESVDHGLSGSRPDSNDLLLSDPGGSGGGPRGAHRGGVGSGGTPQRGALVVFSPRPSRAGDPRRRSVSEPDRGDGRGRRAAARPGLAGLAGLLPESRRSDEMAGAFDLGDDRSGGRRRSGRGDRADRLRVRACGDPGGARPRLSEQGRRPGLFDLYPGARAGRGGRVHRRIGGAGGPGAGSAGGRARAAPTSTSRPK